MYFYLVSWKLKKFKIVEKSVKTENLYTYSDQRGILFEAHNPPNVAHLIETPKSAFSWCFLCKKTMNAKIVNNEKY